MIGDRLKEERDRLGLTQPVFAGAAGTKKRTLIDWEKGVSSPTAVQLSALSDIGADIQYIVTGVLSEGSLSKDEQELVAAFRAAPLAVKAAAIGALTSGTTAPTKKLKQVVKGTANQVAGRDLANHKGVTNEIAGGTKARGKRGK